MTILAPILAIYLGLKIPDIDLAPLLWRHRSAWTHGPAWALIIPWVPMPDWAIYAPPAFLLGITIHLIKDLFPKKWVGAALINTAPMRWQFGPTLSFLYIGASAAYTATRLWQYISHLI